MGPSIAPQPSQGLTDGVVSASHPKMPHAAAGKKKGDSPDLIPPSTARSGPSTAPSPPQGLIDGVVPASHPKMPHAAAEKKEGDSPDLMPPSTARLGPVDRAVALARAR